MGRGRAEQTWGAALAPETFPMLKKGSSLSVGALIPAHGVCTERKFIPNNNKNYHSLLPFPPLLFHTLHLVSCHSLLLSVGYAAHHILASPRAVPKPCTGFSSSGRHRGAVGELSLGRGTSAFSTGRRHHQTIPRVSESHRSPSLGSPHSPFSAAIRWMFDFIQDKAEISQLVSPALNYFCHRQ